MKILILLLVALFLVSCTSQGGSNILDDTITDLKKEGIGFDKETLIELFRFFLQLKKDYQSMTYNEFKIYSEKTYRFIKEQYKKPFIVKN